METPDITIDNLNSASSLKRLIQNRDLLRAELRSDPRAVLLKKIENKINSKIGIGTETRDLIDGIFDGSRPWSMKDMPKSEGYVTAIYKGANIMIPKDLKISGLKYKYTYTRPSKGHSNVYWSAV